MTVENESASREIRRVGPSERREARNGLESRCADRLMILGGDRATGRAIAPEKVVCGSIPVSTHCGPSSHGAVSGAVARSRTGADISTGQSCRH